LIMDNETHRSLRKIHLINKRSISEAIPTGINPDKHQLQWRISRFCHSKLASFRTCFILKK
jgi:hypothetical protein